MSNKLSLERLQEAAKDLNSLPEPFDPPLNEEETDAEVLIDELKRNAFDLEEKDEVSNNTKVVLKELGVGPWLDEELEDEDEAEADEEIEKSEETEEKSKEEEKQEEKAVKKNNTASKAKTTPKKVVAKKPIPKKKAEAAFRKTQKKTVRRPKKEKYTRIMAFADAIREGGKNDQDLIKKAAALYNKRTTKKNPSIKVAAEIHMYCMGGLRALGLIKEKDGRISV